MQVKGTNLYQYEVSVKSMEQRVKHIGSLILLTSIERSRRRTESERDEDWDRHREKERSEGKYALLSKAVWLLMLVAH